jgi:hypothetical protein
MGLKIEIAREHEDGDYCDRLHHQLPVLQVPLFAASGPVAVLREIQLAANPKTDDVPNHRVRDHHLGVPHNPVHSEPNPTERDPHEPFLREHLDPDPGGPAVGHGGHR